MSTPAQAAPESFDLSQFDVRPKAQEGVAMPLLNPAGLPTPVVLRVRGVDSSAYQGMLEEQIRRGADRGLRKQTEQERNAEFMELMATLVCGWTPARIVIVKDGAPAEHSAAAAALLLKEHPYILEQVHRFARARENFLPGSAPS